MASCVGWGIEQWHCTLDDFKTINLNYSIQLTFSASSKGMTAQRSGSGQGPPARASMLSPELRVEHYACVELFWTFATRLAQQGALDVTISDIYSNNTLVWAARSDRFAPLSGLLSLGTGTYRFNISGLLYPSNGVHLTRVRVSLHDEIGRCNLPGTCCRNFVTKLYGCSKSIVGYGDILWSNNPLKNWWAKNENRIF